MYPNPHPLASLLLASLLLATLLLVAGVSVAAAPDPAPAVPPPPDQAPNVRSLEPTPEPPGLFTYTVDGACRVSRTRKLQGPENMDWRDVERRLEVSRESTVWRMIDGQRRQLIERRVRLLGELVQGGELYCLLNPMGQLVEAWIERTDPDATRYSIPRREPAPLRDGLLADLGTFSVILQPLSGPSVEQPAQRPPVRRPTAP
jgi:hypothetical protein